MDTSITFPGIPAIVPAARRFMRGILEGSPSHADAELIAGELISNAIRHTPAGRDGGEFTVTIRTAPGWAPRQQPSLAPPGVGTSGGAHVAVLSSVTDLPTPLRLLYSRAR